MRACVCVRVCVHACVVCEACSVYMRYGMKMCFVHGRVMVCVCECMGCALWVSECINERECAFLHSYLMLYIKTNI